MSYVTARKADDFLAYVNEYVRCVDGEVQYIPHDERSGQKTLGFEKVQPLVFTVAFDLVIQGDCAEGYREASLRFPMGECMKHAGKENEPARSWLHEVVKGNNARKVLVFPQCCGPYSSNFQDLVRRALPEVEFHFPIVHDLYDNVHSRLDQLCRHFFEAKLMKGKDA